MGKVTTKYSGLPEWLQSYNLSEIEWNGVRAFIGVLPVSLLVHNDGQIDGLPSNPREWTRDELDSLKNSIMQTPELMLGRGCLVVPLEGTETLVVLGGNMRLDATLELGIENLPVVIYPEETPLEKKLEIVIKDNNSWGRYDWDKVANEWTGYPLGDWGMNVWELAEHAGNGGDDSEGSGSSSSSSSSSGEDGSTTSNRLLLQFNNNKVQMTEAELEGLQSIYEKYVEETGANFGFVTFLIEKCSGEADGDADD